MRSMPDIWLPLYHRGKRVQYENTWYAIDHVTLSGGSLKVHLIDGPVVNSTEIYVEPTKLSNNLTNE